MKTVPTEIKAGNSDLLNVILVHINEPGLKDNLRYFEKRHPELYRKALKIANEEKQNA